MATKTWDPVADVSSDSESELKSEHSSEIDNTEISDPNSHISDASDPDYDIAEENISDYAEDCDIDIETQHKTKQFWTEGDPQVCLLSLCLWNLFSSIIVTNQNWEPPEARTPRSLTNKQSGPNLAWLHQCWSQCPKQIKEIRSKYSDNELCKKGYLDPIQIWWSIWQQTRLKHDITLWTNNRVQQKIDETSEDDKTYKYWVPIDETLLMMVNVLKLATGEFRRRDQKSYWATDGTGLEIISNILSRNMFFRIIRNITTYNPNDNKPKFDNSWKGTTIWNRYSKYTNK